VAGTFNVGVVMAQRSAPQSLGSTAEQLNGSGFVSCLHRQSTDCIKRFLLMSQNVMGIGMNVFTVTAPRTSRWLRPLIRLNHDRNDN